MDHILGLATVAILVIFLAMIFANAYVLLFGAPYLPSLKPHIAAAFELLDLKPGQTVYDLGCGDGRFLKAAAQRGYKAVGYELNPFFFAWAWLSTRRYRKNIELHFANYWPADISKADAVFVFLLTKYMSKLDKKMAKEGKEGLRLASHTFKIPGKKIAAQKYGVFLYRY